MSYYTIESKDFFEIQRKDLCKEFKDDIMAYSSCLGSASDFSHNLMRSAGMFGNIKKGVNIRLGKLPMRITKEALDNILSRAKGECHVWNVPPGASSEKKEFAEKMVNSCLAGIEKFRREFLGEKEKQEKLI